MEYFEGHKTVSSHIKVGNNLCENNSSTAYSMPQFNSTMTKPVQNDSKIISSEPKPRYTPIMPKQSPNDTFYGSGAIGLNSISKSNKLAKGNYEKDTNGQSTLKKEAEKCRKKSTKSKNITNEHIRTDEVQNKNSKNDKSLSPIKILPKDPASASTEYRFRPEIVESDCDGTEDPPQISILDEAMEVCGILNENSPSDGIMVDGVIPIKGSVLKDALRIETNSGKLQVCKAPSTNSEGVYASSNQGTSMVQNIANERLCHSVKEDKDLGPIDCGGQGKLAFVILFDMYG